MDYFRCNNPLAPDAPDFTEFTSVAEWLSAVKMSRYLENFERGGVTTIDSLVKVQSTDLVNMGITLVGHQKKLLQAIDGMRTQLSVNVSEGYLI